MFRCRLIIGCGMMALSAVTGLTNETASEWIRGLYTGQSPRQITAGEMEAWQQASTLAENTPAAFVLVGSGESMDPLYRPGTILVLRQLPYAELKRGQTALYRSKQHKVVAHLLVAKARDGWRAQGLNNRIHDMEPVCADNLIGVVIAAFQPATSDRSMPLVTAR